nr:hypothetical protein [Chlamydiota bacterium]
MGISVFGLRTSAGLWRGTRSGEIVRRAAIIQKEYDVQKVHFFKNAPTAMEIQTLLARCPRLEVLDLSGCPLSPKEMNEIS